MQFENQKPDLLISRRRLLLGGAALACIAACPPAMAARGNVKALSFYNLHTEEKETIEFARGGKFDSKALDAINHLLRDHRTGDKHPIDPQLLSDLHALYNALGSRSPVEIISGYRSPKTNTMLNKNGGGVAHKSLHMQGKAIDFRLNDKDLAYVKQAAMDMQRGGVGYYADSRFVHIDTGRVRSW